MRTGMILLAACACACSTSGNVGGVSEDASVLGAADATSGDSAPPPVDAEAGSDAVAPALDAGAADAADAATDSSSCAWQGTVESPACSACLRASCCATTTACENDPSCVALDSCVNGCLEDAGADGGSVSTCAQSCSDSQPQAVRDEWHAWNDCIGAQCGATSGAGPCL